MGDDDNDDDRTPAAILTPTQREHLRDPNLKSTPATRALRSRVRRRLRAAIVEDAEILFAALRDGRLDAKKTVEEETGAAGVGTDRLAYGLRDMVASVAELSRASRLDIDRLVEDGVDRSEGSYAEELYTRFKENPENITIGEVNLLVERGFIDKQERNDAIDAVTSSSTPPGGRFGSDRGE